jgi:hypothetical protein
MYWRPIFGIRRDMLFFDLDYINPDIFLNTSFCGQPAVACTLLVPDKRLAVTAAEGRDGLK